MAFSPYSGADWCGLACMSGEGLDHFITGVLAIVPAWHCRQKRIITDGSLLTSGPPSSSRMILREDILRVGTLRQSRRRPGAAGQNEFLHVFGRRDAWNWFACRKGSVLGTFYRLNLIRPSVFSAAMSSPPEDLRGA